MLAFVLKIVQSRSVVLLYLYEPEVLVFVKVDRKPALQTYARLYF